MAYQGVSRKQRNQSSPKCHTFRLKIRHILALMGFSLTRRKFLETGSSVVMPKPAAPAALVARKAEHAFVLGSELDFAFRALFSVRGNADSIIRPWCLAKAGVGLDPDCMPLILSDTPIRIRHLLEEVQEHLETFAKLNPSAEFIQDAIRQLDYSPDYMKEFFGGTELKDYASFVQKLGSSEGKEELLRTISNDALKQAMIAHQPDALALKAKQVEFKRQKEDWRKEQRAKAAAEEAAVREQSRIPVFGTRWRKDVTPVPHDYYAGQPADSWHERLVEQATQSPLKMRG